MVYHKFIHYFLHSGSVIIKFLVFEDLLNGIVNFSLFLSLFFADEGSFPTDISKGFMRFSLEVGLFTTNLVVG